MAEEVFYFPVIQLFDYSQFDHLVYKKVDLENIVELQFSLHVTDSLSTNSEGFSLSNTPSPGL